MYDTEKDKISYFFGCQWHW